MGTLGRSHALRTFAVFGLAYFLSSLVRSITATLAPTLVDEFALSAGNLGLLAGAYFLGFTLTQIPLGRLLDRLGPKRVELGFLLLALLGCIAFASAPGFYALLLARLLTGVGLSACLMAPLTGYRRWFRPAQLMPANAWMLMVGASGVVSATLPVQWLLPLLGWRLLFLGLALAIACAMVLIAWQVPPWRPLAPSTADALGAHSVAPSYAEVLRHPYFRKLAPLGFFCYGGLVAMQTLWAGPWLVKVAAYTPAQAGQGLFAMNVGILVAYGLWGWANPWLLRKGYGADRLIQNGMPLSLGLMLAISVLGAMLAPVSTLLWVLYGVAATVSTLSQPAVALAMRPELAGRALSAFNLVVFAGVFVVQWGIGLGIDALLAHGISQPRAYQISFGIYAVCSAGAYGYFCRFNACNALNVTLKAALKAAPK
jgi:MFS family permease